MKLVKTASGKKTIKMSKKEWQSIGVKAGWIKTAYDQYDSWDKLYGTDSDDGYDAMRDFGGDIDEARRSLEQSGQNVDLKREEMSPFEKYIGWGQKLPPELEKEKNRQHSMMTDTLVEHLGMRKSDVNGNVVINPWSETDDNYSPSKAENLLMNGAREGKWDKYLAKNYLREMQKTHNSLIG